MLICTLVDTGISRCEECGLWLGCAEANSSISSKFALLYCMCLPQGSWCNDGFLCTVSVCVSIWIGCGMQMCASLCTSSNQKFVVVVNTVYVGQCQLCVSVCVSQGRCACSQHGLVWCLSKQATFMCVPECVTQLRMCARLSWRAALGVCAVMRKRSSCVCSRWGCACR